jgi:hypothetical protein
LQIGYQYIVLGQLNMGTTQKALTAVRLVGENPNTALRELLQKTTL